MTPPKLAASSSADPLASFDLDTLVTGAMRLRPDRMALADSSGAHLTYAELDAVTTSLAAHLADLGLVAGEVLLIAGGARASSVIAMIAGVRAGLDVALAPLHLSPGELTNFAIETKAAAMAAEASYGELAPIGDLFAAASRAPCVRLVCNLGAGITDAGGIGAGSTGGNQADDSVDLDLGRLEQRPSPVGVRAPGLCKLIAWREDQVQIHTQQALVAAGLELLSRAHIGMRNPIVSTLAPIRFGALAAGPFAALLAGCALHFHGPFDAEAFVSQIGTDKPAHLVAPQVLAAALARDGWLATSRQASLMLSGGDALFEAPTGMPVIELDRLKE